MTRRIETAAADLRSDLARSQLPVRRKPYWYALAPGQHLGFYKGRRCATWVGRWYAGEGQYRERSLGLADDRQGLDFEAAVALVRSGAGPGEEPPPVAAAGQDAPATVVLGDEVPHFEEQWRKARPDLDVDLGLVGVFVRIERLQFHRHQWLEALAGSEGIGVGDLYVLGALRRAGPPHALRPTDLFRALVVTSGAISKRIDRLAAAGLVRRVADAGDKRSWTVELTRPGVAAANRAMTSIAALWNDLGTAAGLSPRDIRLLDVLLRQLLERMPQVTRAHIDTAPSPPR